MEIIWDGWFFCVGIFRCVTWRWAIDALPHDLGKHILRDFDIVQRLGSSSKVVSKRTSIFRDSENLSGILNTTKTSYCFQTPAPHAPEPLTVIRGGCQGWAENNTQESHSKFVRPEFTLVLIARRSLQHQMPWNLFPWSCWEFWTKRWTPSLFCSDWIFYQKKISFEWHWHKLFSLDKNMSAGLTWRCFRLYISLGLHLRLVLRILQILQIPPMSTFVTSVKITTLPISSTYGPNLSLDKSFPFV